jgi:hypothetical protein
MGDRWDIDGATGGPDYDLQLYQPTSVAYMDEQFRNLLRRRRSPYPVSGGSFSHTIDSQQPHIEPGDPSRAAAGTNRATTSSLQSTLQPEAVKMS